MADKLRTSSRAYRSAARSRGRRRSTVRVSCFLAVWPAIRAIRMPKPAGIFDAGHARRVLDVNSAAGAADRRQAELDLAASGMDDRFVSLGGQHFPERSARRRAPADRSPPAPRRPRPGSSTAQAGSVLGDEFGVEGDHLRLGELAAIGAELRVGGDGLVRSRDVWECGRPSWLLEERVVR